MSVDVKTPGKNLTRIYLSIEKPNRVTREMAEILQSQGCSSSRPFVRDKYSSIEANGNPTHSDSWPFLRAINSRRCDVSRKSLFLPHVSFQHLRRGFILKSNWREDYILMAGRIELKKMIQTIYNHCQKIPYKVHLWEYKALGVAQPELPHMWRQAPSPNNRINNFGKTWRQL
jgi:hypothetical protein